MTGTEVRFKLPPVARRGRKRVQSHEQRQSSLPPAPRLTRLMALAIRFEHLMRQGLVRDYADLARLGGVSRPRVTQIMGLSNLAPEVQEEILFGRQPRGLTERHLRPLAARLDWDEQRELWKRLH